MIVHRTRRTRSKPRRATSCWPTLAGRESGELTGEGTVIVLERSTRSDEPTAPEGWDITDRRDYGETAVYYIEPAESADPAEPVESAD